MIWIILTILVALAALAWFCRKKFAVIVVSTAVAATGGLGIVDTQINPYIDKGDYLETQMVQTLPEAGEAKVRLVKSEPKVVLEKWNGEVALGVSYQNVKARGVRSFITNRMEWRDGAQEVHAYPLPTGEGMEDGGFEIEIILNGKPTTNIFKFQIDGAENLNFFYQSELTQEEIDEGGVRPENVVGSYAVYHSTKSNHRIGSINYATGKVFHIYRPKAIDANGVEAWADLNIDEAKGLLTVTVPQKFLDEAVYPVMIDPTFGYTTQGGTVSNLAGGTMRINYPNAAPENGTLDSLSVYKSNTLFSTDNARPVIYNSGTLARVDFGAQFSALSGWYTTNLTGASIVSGTNYGLGLWIDTTAFEAVYDSNVSYELDRDNETYSSSADPPATFVVASTIADRRYSIYATYTASGGGGPDLSPKVEIRNGETTIQNGETKIQYLWPPIKWLINRAWATIK